VTPMLSVYDTESKSFNVKTRSGRAGAVANIVRGCRLLTDFK